MVCWHGQCLILCLAGAAAVRTGLHDAHASSGEDPETVDFGPGEKPVKKYLQMYEMYDGGETGLWVQNAVPDNENASYSESKSGRVVAIQGGSDGDKPTKFGARTNRQWVERAWQDKFTVTSPITSPSITLLTWGLEQRPFPLWIDHWHSPCFVGPLCCHIYVSMFCCWVILQVCPFQWHRRVRKHRATSSQIRPSPSNWQSETHTTVEAIVVHIYRCCKENTGHPSCVLNERAVARCFWDLSDEAIGDERAYFRNARYWNSSGTASLVRKCCDGN